MKTNADYWDDFVLNNATPAYIKWFKGEKEYLLSHVRENASVLEVGCGNGRSINDLLPITKNITGIDIDAKAIAEAKERFKEYESITLLVEDGANMSFSEHSFDYVICITTFANFADKKYDILKEMKRVLTKNGEMIISVFNENALDERMKVYDASGASQKIISVDENGTVTFDPSLEANISEQFSETRMHELLSKVGLQIYETKNLGIANIYTITRV